MTDADESLAVRAAWLHYVAGMTQAEVARRAASSMRRDLTELREKGVVGSPAEIVDKIGQFGEVGCDRLYLRLADLRDIDHLELVASEVLPHV